MSQLLLKSVMSGTFTKPLGELQPNNQHCEVEARPFVTLRTLQLLASLAPSTPARMSLPSYILPKIGLLMEGDD